MAALPWTSRRSVPVLLTAATALPIAVIGWLGVRLIQQEHVAERERRQEALKGTAAQVVLAIDAALGSIEERLARGEGIRFLPDRLDAPATSPLLYGPFPRSRTATLPPLFAEAEALEYRRHDLAGAAQRYELGSRSADPMIRAEALLGLAAIRRKQGDENAARRAYEDLARLGSVSAGGEPAELVAARALGRLDHAAGELRLLKLDATHLARRLYSGQAGIDRTTFESYRDEIVEWGGPPPPPDAIARTDAAIALWRAWRGGELPLRARRIMSAGGTPLLAVWTGGPTGPVATLMTRADLEGMFAPRWRAHHLIGAIHDVEGTPLVGGSLADAITLTPGDTRLPFILRLTDAPGATPSGGADLRRRTMIGGLVCVLGLMVAAAYGIWRTTTREMALAKQQADFVSAVSHEFRTPLTSLRHLTHLLAAGGIRDEARKRTYYALLARETERLHRMVENLLSVSRLQAGAYAWRPQPVELNDLAVEVVDECQRRMSGRPIQCETAPDGVQVRGDREALARALSNLIENADKYSAAGHPIWVRVERGAAGITLSVSDQGVGIPAGEQKRLFERFARGTYARESGIAGLGVGLALVKGVAEAHGGSVHLDSEPGRGSTFTIVLPADPAPGPTSPAETAIDSENSPCRAS